MLSMVRVRSAAKSSPATMGGDVDHGSVDGGGRHRQVPGQVGEEHHRVAYVFGQVAVVQLAVRALMPRKPGAVE